MLQNFLCEYMYSDQVFNDLSMVSRYFVSFDVCSARTVYNMTTCLIYHCIMPKVEKSQEITISFQAFSMHIHASYVFLFIFYMLIDFKTYKNLLVLRMSYTLRHKKCVKFSYIFDRRIFKFMLIYMQILVKYWVLGYSSSKRIWLR